MPASSPASAPGGRGFLLVTGHVGNWEMGAVTLKAHGLTAAVVGQPELDPNVQEMRLKLRARLGVESIDIGSSMADRLQGARRRGPRAGRGVARRPRLSRGPRLRPLLQAPTPFLRSPALLRALLRLPGSAGFFLRAADGSYFNVWGAPLWPDASLSPEEDAVRIMTRVAADLESVVRAHPTQWFNFYRFWNGTG